MRDPTDRVLSNSFRGFKVTDHDNEDSHPGG